MIAGINGICFDIAAKTSVFVADITTEYKRIFLQAILFCR